MSHICPLSSLCFQTAMIASVLQSSNHADCYVNNKLTATRVVEPNTPLGGIMVEYVYLPPWKKLI